MKPWNALPILLMLAPSTLQPSEAKAKRIWMERRNNEIYRAGWTEFRGGWKPDGMPFLMDCFRGGRVPIGTTVDAERWDYNIGSPDGLTKAPVLTYDTSIGGHYWMTDIHCTCVGSRPEGVYVSKKFKPGMDLTNTPIWGMKPLDIGMTAEECWTRPYLSVKDLGKGEFDYSIERGSDKMDIFYSAEDDPSWHMVEDNPKSSLPQGRVKIDREYVKNHKKIAVIFEVYKAVAIYTRTYLVGEDFAKDQQYYLSLMYPELKLATEKPKWWYFCGTYNPRVPEGNGWPVMAPEKEKITLDPEASVRLKTRTKQVEGKEYIEEKNVAWEILLAPEGCSISTEGEFKAGTHKGVATVRGVLAGCPGVMCDVTITIP